MEKLKELKNPKNEYRPMNYWGWLENIQPEEVKWQVREMHRAGLGGYVMHARGGLEVPYMGKQWLDSVAAMVETGKELGMLSIVDDEDGWPSGFGAGEVNGKGKEYWLKWLEFAKVKVGELELSEDTLGVYSLKDNEICRITDISAINDSNTEVVHFYYKTNKYYVDNLNSEVVKEFIKASYEKYYTEFKEEFGNGIWAVFSDEPQLARQYVPWSDILTAEFLKRCGYNLLDVLPAVFYPTGDYQKIRYDFWNTVNRLFEESYGKQIGEWCSRHNVIFTGHTVYEEWLGTQMLGSGGTMPFYEHMQIPGIDWLGRIAVFNMIVKQVSSVSEQLGKQRVLSEMFGCAGWNVSFEELKWIGEWHYVLGINLMLQHLGLYSLKGSRKREYPASLFYQQPWWEEYRHFNDYFARLSEILAESEPQIDILLLHPLKSAWISFNGSDYEKTGWTDHGKIEGSLRGEYEESFADTNRLDAGFKYLTDSLLELNYDFHYGDEEILSRYGSVECGKLKVGKCKYSVVIIPPSISIDRSTLRLLRDFADAGGTIISAGEFPELVEGTCTGETNNLRCSAIAIPNEKDYLRETLAEVLIPPVYIKLCNGEENKNIYCCTRKLGNELIYYIVNTSIDKSYEIDIRIERKEHISRLYLDDCTMRPYNSLEKIRIDPAESIILLQAEHGTACEKTDIQSARQVSEMLVETEDEWDIKEFDMNSLTLDYCRYSIDGGEWQKEMPVIMLQQKMVGLGRPADVKMAFRFFAEAEFNTPMFLVIEEPDKFSIELNGKKINAAECGWWVDKSFRKIEITGKVDKGWNEITLSRHFYCSDKVYATLSSKGVHEAETNRLRYDTELESIYLLGKFKVNTEGFMAYGDRRAVTFDGSFRLSPMTAKARLSNLAAEGFPFFAGKLRLSQKVNLTVPKKGEKLLLSFNRPDATVTKIFVNGNLVKTFSWAPYSVDISDFAVTGENEIIIELVNSLRNLLGPHHNKGGELYGVGPHSFRNEKSWTDTYCFVRFGIEAGIKVTLLSDE